MGVLSAAIQVSSELVGALSDLAAEAAAGQLTPDGERETVDTLSRRASSATLAEPDACDGATMASQFAEHHTRVGERAEALALMTRSTVELFLRPVGGSEKRRLAQRVVGAWRGQQPSLGRVSAEEQQPTTTTAGRTALPRKTAVTESAQLSVACLRSLAGAAHAAALATHRWGAPTQERLLTAAANVAVTEMQFYRLLHALYHAGTGVRRARTSADPAPVIAQHSKRVVRSITVLLDLLESIADEHAESTATPQTNAHSEHTSHSVGIPPLPPPLQEQAPPQQEQTPQQATDEPAPDPQVAAGEGAAHILMTTTEVGTPLPASTVPAGQSFIPVAAATGPLDCRPVLNAKQAAMLQASAEIDPSFRLRQSLSHPGGVSGTASPVPWESVGLGAATAGVNVREMAGAMVLQRPTFAGAAASNDLHPQPTYAGRPGMAPAGVPPGYQCVWYPVQDAQGRVTVQPYLVPSTATGAAAPAPMTQQRVELDVHPAHSYQSTPAPSENQSTPAPSEKRHHARNLPRSVLSAITGFRRRPSDASAAGVPRQASEATLPGHVPYPALHFSSSTTHANGSSTELEMDVPAAAVGGAPLKAVARQSSVGGAMQRIASGALSAGKKRDAVEKPRHPTAPTEIAAPYESLARCLEALSMGNRYLAGEEVDYAAFRRQKEEEKENKTKAKHGAKHDGKKHHRAHKHKKGDSSSTSSSSSSSEGESREKRRRNKSHERGEKKGRAYHSDGEQHKAGKEADEEKHERRASADGGKHERRASADGGKHARRRFEGTDLHEVERREHVIDDPPTKEPEQSHPTGDAVQDHLSLHKLPEFTAGAGKALIASGDKANVHLIGRTDLLTILRDLRDATSEVGGFARIKKEYDLATDKHNRKGAMSLFFMTVDGHQLAFYQTKRKVRFSCRVASQSVTLCHSTTGVG